MIFFSTVYFLSALMSVRTCPITVELIATAPRSTGFLDIHKYIVVIIIIFTNACDKVVDRTDLAFNPRTFKHPKR